MKRNANKGKRWTREDKRIQKIKYKRKKKTRIKKINLAPREEKTGKKIEERNIGGCLKMVKENGNESIHLNVLGKKDTNDRDLETKELFREVTTVYRCTSPV